MAIFPSIEHESTVQVNDRTRISALKSFVSPDSEISKVEIKPIASGEFVDVTDVDGWYLDWVYSAAETVTISVKVTSGLSPSEVTLVQTSTISVVSSATDALLSADQDLKVHESEIFDLLKAGRSSFKDVHRRARKLIIDQISEENRKNGTGNTIAITDIFDVTALKDWATFLALRLIMFDNSVSIEDRFERKADYYKAYENQAKFLSLSSVEFDEDQSGAADAKSPNFSSVKMVRR